MENEKPKLIQIVKYVEHSAAYKWEEIGLELDVGDDDGKDMDLIRNECKGVANECFRRMIKMWLRSEDQSQITWKTLLDCLQEFKLSEAVHTVETKVMNRDTLATGEISSQNQNTPETKKVKLVVTRDGIEPSDSINQKPIDKLDQSLALTEESKTQDSGCQLPVTGTESVKQAPSVPPYDSVQDDLNSQQHIAASPISTLKSPNPLSVTTPDDVDLQAHETAKPIPMHGSPVECSSQPLPLSISLPHVPPCQPISFELQLEGMTIRNYQRELAEPGIRGENYIFVAPTGSGKTLVAALIICDHLNKKLSSEEEAKVIFLVNTKPLAEQQRQELSDRIKGARVECVTGESLVSVKSALPEKDIIVCTAGKFFDEVRKEAVKIDSVSLLVMDECHHTRKQSVQVQLMMRYFQKKYAKSRCQLPQVVGLTASPGAGANPHLEHDKTIDHLVNLCAMMDATSGLKTVQEHKKELEQFTTKPILTHETLRRRSEDEDFLKLISEEMEYLEKQIDVKMSSVPKWSQQYETKIQQEYQKCKISLDPTLRDKISTLELLLCYSQALNIYMDLQHEDALRVLTDFTDFPELECTSVSTEWEIKLKQRLNIIIKLLKALPIIENPLLKKAEEIIVERIKGKIDSRGMFFVRTKCHAMGVFRWIKDMAIRHKFCLKPELMMGHTRETGSGMTQADQQEAMNNFRTGKSNILVATSVAEEGLDVPACNFVIRFQHISNEIAKVQTQGRARAEDSEVFTILSYDSKMNMKEIKNAELLILVDDIMAKDWFPREHVLHDKLTKIQKKFLQDQEMKRSLRQKRKQAPGEDITLRCRKCKAVACHGSDIFIDGSHHLVPEEKFKEKIVKKPHHKPGNVSDNVSKTHKIYCRKCGTDWGIMCVWEMEHYEFPILKCKSFLFENSKKDNLPVTQWSKAPFVPLPLTDWIEPKGTSSDEDDEA